MSSADLSAHRLRDERDRYRTGRCWSFYNTLQDFTQLLAFARCMQTTIVGDITPAAAPSELLARLLERVC
jgi:hypothetical protein